MAYLRAFGAYLPSRVVTNEEIGAWAGSSPDWILNVSGIEERRFAAEGETVAEMASNAACDCLTRAGLEASSLGMILVTSGSSERRFPGPAAAVAARLGLTDIPALDVPMASAGSLFALVLADRLASVYGPILIVGSERMSPVIQQEPVSRGTAVLFGDGAGACLVTPEAGPGSAKILDSTIQTDGSFAEDLRLEFGKPLDMNGRSVILQASRKIPRAISSLLERQGRAASAIDVFLMHQANHNLIVRVADALGVASEKFYSNIRQYGNTSSASMLIAAKEWWEQHGFPTGHTFVFAGFGAGFHWGAMLAEGC